MLVSAIIDLLFSLVWLELIILADSTVRADPFQNVIVSPSRSREILSNPSGQLIRLRSEQNRLGVGRVELYHLGQWGLVCDDFFDLQDANVVCRQLGFSRGAIEAKTESYFGFGNVRHFALDNLMCDGTEDSILDCRNSMRTDCNYRTESAGVICQPNYQSQCGPHEILFNNKCLQFNRNQTKTHANAKRHCESQQGTLLVIESQEENDFISEALFLTHGGAEAMWYTAGRMHSDRRWVWDVSQKLTASTFSKWRPDYRQPQSNSCLVMRHNANDFTERNYYFWDGSNCDARLPYICQLPVRNVGCVVDKGITYTGTANVSRTGEVCLKWNDPAVLAAGPMFTQQASQDHNYCRNFDSDQAPWCMVNTRQYDLCDIPSCALDPGSNQPLVAACEPDEIRCGNLTQCVAKDFLCDYDTDCSNGFDEQGCTDWLPYFVQQAGLKLANPISEIWTYVPHAQGCAKRCIEAQAFVCRAFSYTTADQTCTLGTSTVKLGAVVSRTLGSVFYERRSSAFENCVGFRCKNGRCVAQSTVCDRVNDCGDNSDEGNCTNFAIRLRGGSQPSEGRVEVRAYGKWGIVCDDQWDLIDANIVCKQLGYASALSAQIGSAYGSGGLDILMDDVECQGTESSLDNCHFAGWGQNDCGNDEAAGVVCKTVSNTTDASTSICAENQFQCNNRQCIDITWICDGEADCSDNSDEVQGKCNAPLGIRLMDGPDRYSGRVEVSFYGMWGTVCDDGWNANAAKVACRMLGRNGQAVAHQGGSKYPAGRGLIWLDETGCNGTEASLKDCKHSRLAYTDCKHEEDAGVTCLELPEVTQPPAAGECGRRYVHTLARDPRKPVLARVVGGFDAEPGAYPWTVAIRLRPDRHHCGGTILGEYSILTAAHCFEDERELSSFEVVVGDFDNTKVDGTEQSFEVDSITVYDGYQSVLKDDIAMLKIKPKEGRGIQFTSVVQPICLPDVNASYAEGTRCTVSGWGSVGSSFPQKMQAAQLPMLSRSKCTNAAVYGKMMSEHAFCAGFLRGGIDSCQGDSGGPYACDLDGRFTLLGVVSWGDGCAQKNKPGIYTKVTDYLPWIYSHM